MNVGMFIKQIRKKLKLSQLEFATLVGVNQVTISHCERGLRKPSVKVLNAIVSVATERNIDIKINDIFN